MIQQLLHRLVNINWNCLESHALPHMSSFNVRKVSYNSSHLQGVKQKPPQKLSVQPSRIIFEIKDDMNKVNIVKLVIKNTSMEAIEFQIRQPKYRYFRVKFSKTLLLADQEVEIFLFFNFQPTATNIDDQFIVLLNYNSENCNITIPIFVRTAQKIKQVLQRFRKQSKTKENVRIMRLPHNFRLIGQKRYAGLMATSQGKTKQEIEQATTFHGRIKAYEREYSNIVNFLKQKTIKCQIYRGEKPMTKQRYYQIISFNLTTQSMARDIMREQILQRHKTKKEKNGPSVRVFQQIKIQWNRDRNIPEITYRNGLQKLFKQVRSFVIYHRFKKMNKILSIYRNLREEENVQQPQTKIINNKFDVSVEEVSLDTSLLDDQNQEDREYKLQIQAKKKHNYYCKKIKKIVENKKDKNLGADFAQFTLTPRLLPIDEQQTKNHIFEIKPRIEFDNWVAVEELAPYHHELMNYQKSEGIPKWQCHPCFDFDHGKSNSDKLSNDLDVTNSQFKQLPTLFSLQMKNSQKFISKQMEPNCEQFQYNSSKLFTKYKRYNAEYSEVDFLCAKDEQSMEMGVMMPQKGNYKALQQIKCTKQQYMSYYNSPVPSPCHQIVNKCHVPVLIEEVKKQDLIGTQKQNPKTGHKIAYAMKIDNLLRFRHLATIVEEKDEILDYDSSNDNNLGMFNSVETNNDKIDWLETNNVIVEDQDLMYERLLQNIEKVKVKKQDIAHGKIASLNNFVKKYQNMIYY